MINQIISFAFRLHNTYWKLKIAEQERERPNGTKNAQEANQMRTNSRFHDSFFVFFTYCLFLLSSAFFLPTYRSPFHNQLSVLCRMKSKITYDSRTERLMPLYRSMVETVGNFKTHTGFYRFGIMNDVLVVLPYLRLFQLLINFFLRFFDLLRQVIRHLNWLFFVVVV